MSSDRDGGDRAAPTAALAPAVPRPVVAARLPVDNFGFARRHIETVLGAGPASPSGPGYFIPAVVLLRRKDVPELPGKDTSVLLTKNVRDVASLDRIAPIARAMCDATSARFYMKLNKRDDETVAGTAVRLAVDQFVTGNFRAAGKAFHSAVGSKKSPDARPAHKFFMLDVDPTGSEDVPAFVDAAECAIRECWARRRQPADAYDVASVPSKSGVHVVCPAFDKKLFAELMRGQPPIWDLRDDAFVLVYYSGRGSLKW